MLFLFVKHAAYGKCYRTGVETIGDRIKTLRQARGMTQEQLAAYCGVTKSAVSQWENGSTANIKLQPLMRLVDALRTDHAYLIYGERRRPDAAPVHKTSTVK